MSCIVSKVIIFGAGKQGEKYMYEYGNNIKILAFADNLRNKGMFYGHPIIFPDLIPTFEYDWIVIAIDDMNESGRNSILSILEQLKELRIPSDKIMISECRYHLNDQRVDFCRRLSEIFVKKNVMGSIAEAGTYRGHFSAYLNRFFPDRKLFLFDTFEGFPDKDIAITVDLENKQLIEKTDVYDYLLRCGNEEITCLRCINREKVIIRKGYIPETFEGLDKEIFAFCNIDVDLYKPTLGALQFFLPRMAKNGVILVHDYYNQQFHNGIKKALSEVAEKFLFAELPIGDGYSIAIIPQ
ncbi:MAG: TylF/MycF family methyltransferase [Fibromonadaceae bacterium]|jgi:O-methyltransferase|nr:TylF/MycF family methyltransferase [Fibromonadaceae bacterium]